MPRVNLQGSSSVVTGGASGIGEAGARQLAEAGSKVWSRVIQIAIAVIYVVLAFGIVQRLTKAAKKEVKDEVEQQNADHA